MNRLAIVAVGFVATSALATLAADAPEGSSDKRGCGSINLGEPRIFYKHNMRCHKAKHYARRLYKTDGRDQPRRFTCTSNSHFNQGAACRHDFKNKNFGWHPADKRKAAAKRKKCGTYRSESSYARGKVIAIRGVGCLEARKVAKTYDHTGRSRGRWECFLAHGGGRALFSCGYGGTAGDVRDFPHALVAKGVGERDRPLKVRR
ncbi:MAG: hypothetical protein K0R88_1933 [Solirubrobacterales bacterium]|nr:hypothetical protein [Solirubrobacterales bacterium]